MKTQEEHQLRTLQEAVRASFISQGDLWQTYSRLGGIAGHVEVEAHICGLVPLPSEERDLLATAANALIDALPSLPRATYSNGRNEWFPAGTPAD